MSNARSAASEGRSTISDAQETMRFLRQQQAKPDKRVLVTLVGGHRLNPGGKGTPRPVQVCVYLSTTSSWSPTADFPEGGCTTREQDPAILASERRVLAPEQLLQLSFFAPSSRDSWVIVDADFGERAADYKSFRIAVDNQDMVQINTWLDSNRVNNANSYRPSESKP